MIDQLDLFRDCGCYSHNGFLTRRGYKAMRASGVDPLTKQPRGVRLDESVSVSVSEAEAELASSDMISEGAPQALPDPPGAGEVSRG